MSPAITLVLPLLLCLLLPPTQASVSQPWTHYIIDDTIPSFTIQKDTTNILTGQNLTIRGTIVRTCLSSYVPQCTQPDTVTWFLPKSLPPRDNSLRKHFTFAYKLTGSYTNTTTGQNLTNINITSILELRNVGFIHAGHYAMSNYLEQIEFDLVVQENPTQSCTYHDQCNSYNCYADHCQCTVPDFNYDPGTKSCILRSPLGESCTSNIECALSHKLEIDSEFKQSFTPISCAPNGTTSNSKICQCSPGSVQVKVALEKTDACLPKVNLTQICYASPQCEATSGRGAFCGLDMSASSKSANFSLVCQCRDGWRSSADLTSCIAYSACDSSKLGFNEQFLQGSCASDQFCRGSVCLCVPNYEFSSSGSCVFQRGMDRPKSFLELYYLEIIGTVIVVTVLVFVLAIGSVVKSKLTVRRRKKKDARDNEVVFVSRESRRSQL